MSRTHGWSCDGGGVGADPLLHQRGGADRQPGYLGPWRPRSTYHHLSRQPCSGESYPKRFAMGCYWHVQDWPVRSPGSFRRRLFRRRRRGRRASVRSGQVVKYEELVELFASHDPSGFFRAVGEKGPGGKYQMRDICA